VLKAQESLLGCSHSNTELCWVLIQASLDTLPFCSAKVLIGTGNIPVLSIFYRNWKCFYLTMLAELYFQWYECPKHSMTTLGTK
jgi:hypothetical protein